MKRRDNSYPVATVASLDGPPRHHSTVIVDKCRLFREGLTGILQSSRFEIVASATDIQDALQNAHGVAATGPVELLICGLDSQRGIEPQLAAIRAARARDATTKTVLLMPSCSAEDLVAAVLCGADGVILKDISSEALIAALDLVMHGQHVLPLGVTQEVFSTILPVTNVLGFETNASSGLHDRRSAPSFSAISAHAMISDTTPIPDKGVFDTTAFATAREVSGIGPARNIGLSERETQILRCLVQGYANKLIARQLDIAEATVKVHIKGLLRKINVSNRTQAAIWALTQSVTEQKKRSELPSQLGRMQNDDYADAGSSLSGGSLLSEMVLVFPPLHDAIRHDVVA